MDRLEALREALSRRCPGLEVREFEPMSQYTSFRIGGPARLMALPRTEGEARQAVLAARELEVVPFFLGNGSNLLVADGGYPGFIVKLSASASDFVQTREVNRGLEAGGAIPLSRLANAALDRGLTGLEFASGIPGSLGGAVTMNAGAYGGELCQVVESVTVMDRQGNVETVPNADCDFGYRHSAFSGGERLILSARFALEPGDRAEIKARMDDLAARRKEKQPLEWPSAGSTFKRPEGRFAAALIDQCGLKGLTVGGAQVSEKHAGFVINRGGATCADVLELVDQIRSRVLTQTGVELELEIKILGDP